MKAFNEVQKVQKLRPGWRFSLLGGDVQYKYNLTKRGLINKRNPVNPHALGAFGWKAEFFGHIDPRQCSGQRHARGSGWTAEEAILDACREAMAVIKLEHS